MNRDHKKVAKQDEDTDNLQILLHLWANLTKAGFHTHNGKADFSPPLDFYINELTIHVFIIANGYTQFLHQ